jgi:hypothetical protein
MFREAIQGVQLLLLVQNIVVKAVRKALGSPIPASRSDDVLGLVIFEDSDPSAELFPLFLRQDTVLLLALVVRGRPLRILKPRSLRW